MIKLTIKQIEEVIYEQFNETLSVNDPQFCLRRNIKACEKTRDCRKCLLIEFKKKAGE